MIYFITKRKDHDPLIYRSAKITVLTALDKMAEMLVNLYLGFDVEANGKRFFQTELLLIQLGNKENQIVVDFTEPDHLKGWRQEVVDTFNQKILPSHVFVGHNLKYDKNVCTPYGFKLPTINDTMIAEQRLCMGTGLLASYKDTYERRLNKFFPENKETRIDFISMTKNSTMLLKHIMYAGEDAADTIDILEIQKKLLIEYKQAWFTKNVEFPLVSLLSEIELTGMDLDKKVWKALIKKKKDAKFQSELAMDEIVRTLGQGNQKLIGGKYTNQRKIQISVQEDLFGADPVILQNKNTNNINYASGAIVLDVIDRLKLPKPTVLELSGETFKLEEKDSMSEGAIQTYLLEYPTTPIKSFLNKLLEYKGLSKFISSYGDKFLQAVIYRNNKYEIGFVNPITQRVHTVLKQCATATGRLASGEKEEGLFNVQNLPKEKEVREAFVLSQSDIDLDYWFSTCDLSSAELIIMAVLAYDEHLYQLGAINDDIHSPVATKCWRAVYAYRLAKGMTDFTIKDSNGKEYTLTANFVIDKFNNIQLRVDFKPMVFGVFYGLMAKKGGQTLNIAKDEAQVIIDTICKEFPKTIKMLEAATFQAFRHGYVVFNKRSNNRRYFKPVLDVLKTIDQSKYSDMAIVAYVKEKLRFQVQVEIAGESRNCLIQGTQADMIKEAMVRIRQHPDYITTKAKMLLSVHDEVGIKHIGTEFGTTIKEIMQDTANDYLKVYSSHMKMTCSLAVKHSWTK